MHTQGVLLSQRSDGTVSCVYSCEVYINHIYNQRLSFSIKTKKKKKLQIQFYGEPTVIKVKFEDIFYRKKVFILSDSNFQ